MWWIRCPKTPKPHAEIIHWFKSTIILSLQKVSSRLKWSKTLITKCSREMLSLLKPVSFERVQLQLLLKAKTSGLAQQLIRELIPLQIQALSIVKTKPMKLKTSWIIVKASKSMSCIKKLQSKKGFQCLQCHLNISSFRMQTSSKSQTRSKLFLQGLILLGPKMEQVKVKRLKCIQLAKPSSSL